VVAYSRLTEGHFDEAYKDLKRLGKVATDLGRELPWAQRIAMRTNQLVSMLEAGDRERVREMLQNWCNESREHLRLTESTTGRVGQLKRTR